MKRSVILFALFVTLLAGFLRFYKITTNPPGLYIDEASIGYNAYSLLKTGKDEFGVPHPLWFRSFGDYKVPVYIYMTEGSIAIFGKNEFAVRFPSALFGTLTVTLVYLLLRNLFPNEKKKLRFKNFDIGVAEIAAFLLAISPWHLQFSRGGFEVNVGLFFVVFGCYILWIYWKKQSLFFLLLGLFSFSASIYTYPVYRIITPLIVGVLLLLFFLKKPSLRYQVLLGILFFAVINLPIVLFSLTSAGTARFVETSAFSEYKTKSLAEALLTYPTGIIKNYISFFSFRFLFVSGDGIGRHQIVNFGLLPLWQFPFLIIGFFSLLKSKLKIKYLLFIFLAVIPVGASIAVPSPQTLRTLPMVIPLTIIISWGVYAFLTSLKKKKQLAAVLIISIVALYEFLFYLHFYYVHYSKTNILDWGAGYKEVVEKTEKYQKKYDHIVVDHKMGLTYIYFKFYNDKIPIETVSDEWKKPQSWGDGHTLYIRPYYQDEQTTKIIDTVYLKNENKDVFARFWVL